MRVRLKSGAAMANQEQIEIIRDRLHALVEDGDFARAAEMLENIHGADQADLLEHLDREAREALVAAMQPEQFAETLEFLDEELRGELLTDLQAAQLAPILNRLDEDIATDIVQDLEPEQARQVVPLLRWRESVEELLEYPADTAGGRMSIDVVALERRWTVEEAIGYLRRETPDDIHPFYLYVVEEDGRLTGTVSLRSIVTAAPETPIAAVTSEDILTVRASEDQEVAAERMRHYNLLALPVVDEQDRLLGVITADDVLDVQVEEATEDIYRLAGLSDQERIFRPIREAVPQRLGWLFFNLAASLVAAAVISQFEGTIQRVAVLAAFLPLVGAMAGNAGLQTLTLVVRSIALGEVGRRDGLRVLRHEASIALINGLAIGVTAGVIAFVWKDSAWLGLILAIALLANISNAMVTGVVIPMTLRRMNLDPALASGVLVTFVDVMGYLIFLALGAALVDRLT